MAPSPLLKLTRFLAGLTLRDLDPEVVVRARWTLIDTVGIMLAGASGPEAVRLGRRLKPDPEPVKGVTWPGSAGTWPPLEAALLGGLAGSSLEFEEGHSGARGHPAIQLVPALLAAAEAGRLGGEELLLGLLAGYEAGARLSRAASLRQGLHPNGTWGVVGSALGRARLLGMGADDLAGVADLAASFCLTPYVRNSFAGFSAAAAFAGLANQLGLLAGLLYESGLRADPGSLTATFTRFLSTDLNQDELDRDLGRPLALAGSYFKPYPTCRFTHPALDALGALIQKGAFKPEEVAGLEVASFAAAVHPGPLPPPNPEAMRFSLPFQLAALLLKGRVDLTTMTPETLRDPEVAALASKVSLSLSQEYEALRPGLNPARVTVLLENGRRLSHEVLEPRGDPGRPLAEAELLAKFRRLAEPVLGEERCGRFLDLASGLERLPDLRPLLALLRPGQARPDRDSG